MAKTKENALYNREAEENTIGCVLIDPDCFEQLKKFLKPEDFFLQQHRWIWQAFFDLSEQGKPLDAFTVPDELERVGKLSELGGPAYLTALEGRVPSSLHAETYAGIIWEMRERRHIVGRANDMVEQATELVRQAHDLKTPLPISSTATTPKTRWTVPELLATDFPDPTGAVPGFFPVGLSIVGGRPKRGKSWLLLQCAYSIATGGKFLDRDLTKGRALYFALEDSPRRLKDRISKFYSERDPAALLVLDRELKPLYLGGIAQIELAANEYSFIVIDTLGRAMPGKDFNKDAALFADVMAQLQTLAQKNNISIVLSLHTRKPAGQEHDPVDDILGSTQGLTAAPDCVLALYKDQGKTGARLEGRGRDFDDIDLTIEFDPMTCAWQLVGKTGEVLETKNENEIIEALKELGGKARISAIVKTTEMDQGNCSRRCANLWTKGIIKKEVINNVKYYYLPDPPT